MAQGDFRAEKLTEVKMQLIPTIRFGVDILDVKEVNESVNITPIYHAPPMDGVNVKTGHLMKR